MESRSKPSGLSVTYFAVPRYKLVPSFEIQGDILMSLEST